jgi:hypothetical protein
MAEASGVAELEDEEVLQFIERSEAANTAPWGRQGATSILGKLTCFGLFGGRIPVNPPHDQGDILRFCIFISSQLL